MSNQEDLARQLEQDVKDLEARHRQQREDLAEAGEEGADVLVGGVVGSVAGAAVGAKVAGSLSGAVVGGPLGAVVGIAAAEYVGETSAEYEQAKDAEAEADAAERQAEVMERAQHIQREQGVSGPEALKQAQQEADGNS